MSKLLTAAYRFLPIPTLVYTPGILTYLAELWRLLHTCMTLLMQFFLSENILPFYYLSNTVLKGHLHYATLLYNMPRDSLLLKPLKNATTVLDPNLSVIMSLYCTDTHVSQFLNSKLLTECQHIGNTQCLLEKLTSFRIPSIRGK